MDFDFDLMGLGDANAHRQRRRSRASKLDFSEVTDITSFMHVLRLHKYTAGLVCVSLHPLSLSSPLSPSPPPSLSPDLLPPSLSPSRSLSFVNRFLRC